jgi:hypothetical protein
MAALLSHLNAWAISIRQISRQPRHRLGSSFVSHCVHGGLHFAWTSRLWGHSHAACLRFRYALCTALTASRSTSLRPGTLLEQTLWGSTGDKGSHSEVVPIEKRPNIASYLDGNLVELIRHFQCSARSGCRSLQPHVALQLMLPQLASANVWLQLSKACSIDERTSHGHVMTGRTL